MSQRLHFHLAKLCRLYIFILIAAIALLSSTNVVASGLEFTPLNGYTVNSIADTDDGSCDPPGMGTGNKDCTLREAINAANVNIDADVIVFNIPNGCDITTHVCTIAPAFALPTITHSVTIDGYSQPGATANTLTDGDNAVLLVELNGTNAGAGVVGLLITASDSKVKGLIINRFGGDAIRLEDGSGNTIAGNFIGTAASGKIGLGNVGNGVHVEDSPNNLIGGTKPAARNILSSNHHEGVEVEESLSTGNRIQGNFIGTDASGTVALPNLDEGVEIDAAAHNLIGGTVPGAWNLISGNVEFGILFYTDGATDNRVENNVIGLDVTRTKKLGNSHGIKILDVPNNIIGGTAVGAGNLIAGNNLDGVWIDGIRASGNIVQGNFIGAGLGGSGNLGNGQSGVVITGDASQNTIGGRSDRSANIIAHNATNGVTIVSGVSNHIQRNSIYANAGLGIDLGGDGVTPNIAGDTDTGANDLQNFPVVRSARSAIGSITFRLDSIANTTYVVEFFASNQCDGSDYGEGKKFLGSVKVTTDGSGSITATFLATAPFAGSDAITSTATDPKGNTSEFSKCKVAQ